MRKGFKQIFSAIASGFRKIKRLAGEFWKSAVGKFVYGYPYRVAGPSVYFFMLVGFPASLFFWGVFATLGVWAYRDRGTWSLARYVSEYFWLFSVVSAANYVSPWLWGAAFVAVLPVVVKVLPREHKARSAFNHDILETRDLGEDLEGAGAGYRKIQVTVVHTHGKKQFMKTDEIVVPSGATNFMVQFGEEDE